MLSGVMGQMILGSLLAIMYLLSSSDVILYIYITNCIIIFTNMMPFLKLDGYWIINQMIGSEDYMNSFKQFIFKRQKIKSSELLLGLVNCILIATVIFKWCLLGIRCCKERNNLSGNILILGADGYIGKDLQTVIDDAKIYTVSIKRIKKSNERYQ